MNLYEVKNRIIVRTDTGKELKTMKDIAEHMNWLCKHNSYVARKDDDGVEYIDFVGTYADYYHLEELCELINCLEKDFFCDKQWEKHMKIKKSKERKHKVPKYIWDGRFVSDHTARKGFWLEDWITGKVYYFRVKEHIKAIVGLLNSYNGTERYITYKAKCGYVIKDTGNGEIYILGDSSHICELRDWLNWYDFQLYGERELTYRRMMG